MRKFAYYFSYFYSFMYMYIHVCVYGYMWGVCGCVCMYMCRCVHKHHQARGWSRTSSFITLLIVWYKVLSIIWNSWILTGQRDPRLLLFLPPSPQDHKCESLHSALLSLPWVFRWCWGSNQVCMLAAWAMTQQALSPALVNVLRIDKSVNSISSLKVHLLRKF